MFIIIVGNMNLIVKFKQTLLLIGDVIIFYGSLIAVLFLRYSQNFDEFIGLHLVPFSIIMLVWLTTFYIFGLYDLRNLKNDPYFIKQFVILMAVNGVLAIMLFYILPFGITPRINLLIFLIIYSLALYIWRSLFNNLAAAGRPANRLLLIGYNKTIEEIVNHLSGNPQLGYEIKYWMKEGLQDKEFEHLSQIILNNDINIIVIPAHIKKNAKAAKLIYRHLALGIEILDLASLYEMIFMKIPLAELEEVWFLENLTKSYKLYEFFKRPMDIILASLLLILSLPFAIFIAIITKLTSAGPIIIKQKRVGQNGIEFTLYKFRTMVADAEKNGAQWAAPNDKRSTPFGALLRHSHLDELPQLINVLKGELSLIGPRPERPEFVKDLKKEIPFYELRHLVRPGITGWAQINYRYGASIEDAYQKLQYDIYYIKNRSVILDAIIILKTLRFFFVNFT